MKNIPATIILLFVFSISLFAQAYKIDEIGPVISEDLELRVGAMEFELSRNPTAKGIIAIEREKRMPFGFYIRFGERLKKYLTEVLQLPENRFEIVNGGVADLQNIALWVVPMGDKPPLDKSVYGELNLIQTVNFDTFPYPTDKFEAHFPIDLFRKHEKDASLRTFARLLKENSNLNAYVIFYGEYDPKWGDPPDSAATINHILRKEKNYLVRNHKIDPSRLRTINGGYREWQEIELWLVPKGEKPPKPTPETFPKKRTAKKFRKRH